MGTEFAGGHNVLGFTAQPICHGNTWKFSGASYTGAFGNCPGLEAIVVATSGKRITYEGSDTPEGHVTGNIGDEFYRTDGNAGTLLYQKNDGPGNANRLGGDPMMSTDLKASKLP